MAGMEVDAGSAFNVEGKTVTQLITWLQSQDQNSAVKPAGDGSLVFRKLRRHDGGHIRVEVEEPEKEEPKPSKSSRSKSQRSDVI